MPSSEGQVRAIPFAALLAASGPCCCCPVLRTSGLAAAVASRLLRAGMRREAMVSVRAGVQGGSSRAGAQGGSSCADSHPGREPQGARGRSSCPAGDATAAAAAQHTWGELALGHQGEEHHVQALDPSQICLLVRLELQALRGGTARAVHRAPCAPPHGQIKGRPGSLQAPARPTALTVVSSVIFTTTLPSLFRYLST